MKILLAGGTGFIGQALKRHWQGIHEVSILSRQDSADYTWDAFLEKPTQILQNFDIVVNLCGENIGQKRWSHTRKSSLLSSRLIPTRQLAEALVPLGEQAPHLYNASAIGIYGLQKKFNGALGLGIDESFDLRKESSCFLQEIALQWEAAAKAAVQAGVPVTFCRFGVVIAHKGGALPKMTLPFYFGLGGPIGSGNQVLSWIYLADLCRAFDFLIANPQITGPVNLTAPKAVSNREFAHALGRALKRPSMLSLPGWVLQLGYGQMAKELLLSGQHVIPTRLLSHGFHFNYPNIELALNTIYQG